MSLVLNDWALRQNLNLMEKNSPEPPFQAVYTDLLEFLNPKLTV